jgi:hypothetical protein
MLAHFLAPLSAVTSRFAVIPTVLEGVVLREVEQVGILHAEEVLDLVCV